MKSAVPSSKSRRQIVVDSMAKKFADRGNVEQIIGQHRKKLIRSKNTFYLIIGGVVLSMVITTLFSLGVIEPPPIIQKKSAKPLHFPSTIEMLRADVENGSISMDQFAFYCRDLINRYDSLPSRYQTQFSTTTSEEVFNEIVAVWEELSLRTRQSLLEELPYIETVQKRLRDAQVRKAAEHGSGE